MLDTALLPSSTAGRDARRGPALPGRLLGATGSELPGRELGRDPLGGRGIRPAEIGRCVWAWYGRWSRGSMMLRTASSPRDRGHCSCKPRGGVDTRGDDVPPLGGRERAPEDEPGRERVPEDEPGRERAISHDRSVEAPCTASSDTERDVSDALEGGRGESRERGRSAPTTTPTAENLVCSSEAER